MTDLQISAIALVILLVLLFLQVPVAVALGVVSFVGIAVILGADPAWGILTAIPYDFAAHWTLSSVPMFLLMGYVCYYANLTDGLFRMARLWLSALPGGLAVASVAAAAGFSCVTGSSVACAAAMGRIAIPEMLRHNYDKGLAAGTVAAAGTIGSMIPPSIILLIFGVFAEVPIGKLFIGGLLPGLLSAGMFIAMIVIRSSLRPSLAPRPTETISWRDRFSVLFEIWPVLALIIGVFGGFFSGVFTPTEAGAVGAGLAVVIAVARRSLSKSDLWRAMKETMVTTASIFIIAIGANLLTRFLALAGFTDYLSNMVIQDAVGPLGLILGISLVYLVLGMFLDPLGIMLLTLPLFLPIVEAARIDLIWFGILVTKYLEIALITPPVGLNVYVIKGTVGELMQTKTIFKGILWFVVADVITLTLLIYFPQISLWLPSFID